MIVILLRALGNNTLQIGMEMFNYPGNANTELNSQQTLALTSLLIVN